MFLKNAWYVAAWDYEITRELQQIIVLGKKVCTGFFGIGKSDGVELLEFHTA